MIEAKKKIVIAVLCVSFAWPIAHYATVRSLGLNPWNWWGWAMYTMPAPRVKARTVSLETGRDFDPRKATRENARRIQLAYLDYSGKQMELGALHEPEDFARTLLLAYPNESGVRIEVWRVVLDPKSGMVEERKDEGWVYEYRRQDVGL
jgi:hypothetical protein